MIQKKQISTSGWTASVSQEGMVKAAAVYDGSLHTVPVAVNPSDGKMWTLQGGGGGGAAQMAVSDDDAGNIALYLLNTSSVLAVADDNAGNVEIYLS